MLRDEIKPLKTLESKLKRCKRRALGGLNKLAINLEISWIQDKAWAVQGLCTIELLQLYLKSAHQQCIIESKVKLIIILFRLEGVKIQLEYRII